MMDGLQFKGYLSAKGITAVSSHKMELGQQNEAEQIRLMAEFHKKAAGFRAYAPDGLNDNLGKSIEKYKSDIKKFKRLLSDIKIHGTENVFEEELSSTGAQVAAMAERAVAVCCNEKYMDIIKRSMVRAEVCIGDPFFNNLYMDGNALMCYVDNCVYDLVESDCLSFLRKLRRKGIEFDQEILINEFCIIEELDSYSREYISSLMLYPYYLMKSSIRYKEHKKNASPEMYLEKYKNAIKFDGIKMRL